MAEPDTEPRIGRISEREDEVREWAQQARLSWGVPVQVFERSLRAGGVNCAVWVAVLWPGKQK